MSMNVLSHSVVSDSVTPSTVAHQAPLSMDFPGKNTGVGCHFLLQGNLSNSGIEPTSPALLGGLFPTEPAGKPKLIVTKGKMGGEEGQIRINRCTDITIYKINNKYLLYSTGHCIQYSIINYSEKNIYMNHFDVHQKLTCSVAKLCLTLL